jgi:hypothetical protein
MCVAGQGMANQNGVGTIRIERAVGFIRQRKGPEHPSAAEMKRLVKVYHLLLDNPH